MSATIQPYSNYTNPPGPLQAVNQQAASYTLQAPDFNQRVEFNSATAVTLTIPAGVFPVGCSIQIYNLGAGAVAVAAGAGVTIHAKAADAHLAAQFSVAFVDQVRLNEWYFYGDITT